MSLTDQLQSAISTASTLEQQLATQSAQVSTLTQQVQTLTTTNAQLQAKLAAASSPSPSPSSPVVGDPPTAAETMTWGFVASDVDPSAALIAGLNRMKTDGGSWLRLWHSNFGTLSANNIAAINAASALGIRVILCVQPKDGGTKNLGTPDIAGFVSKNAAMLAKVQFVEVGNELNLAEYRPDDLGGILSWQKPYVDRWLAPLHAALLPLKVQTLCTSITDTYNPQTYAQQYDLLHAAGAADPSDGIAIHLYALPQYVPQLPTIIDHLKQTWAKPIYVTECNVLTKNLTPTQWATQFQSYVSTLRQAGVTAAMYYRAIPKTNGTWTWPTLFDAVGNVTDVYPQVLSVMK